MFNNQTSAPRIVRGVEEAAAELEKLAALPLMITREDDWSLTRAICALREIVESNQPPHRGGKTCL